MSMNSGYSGWSMSNRAVEAYEQGEKPKSKWTKKAMVAEINAYCEEFDMICTADLKKMKKDEVFSTFFEWSSWHHTSKFCNATDFYALDEDAVCENARPMTDEEIDARNAAREAERKEREEQEAEWKAAYEKEEAYKKAHGYAYDSAAAYVAENSIEPRISKKGNKVYDFEYDGRRHTVAEWNLNKHTVFGFRPTDF